MIYREKETFEAYQWKSLDATLFRNGKENAFWPDWLKGNISNLNIDKFDNKIIRIQNVIGNEILKIGSYIMKGKKNIYQVDKEFFEKKYEEVI